MKCLPLVSVSILLLAACAQPSGTAASVSPVAIHLWEDPLELPPWMKDMWVDQEVHLFPSGIYALDENVVFLFGGFDAVPGSVRSVLLRSVDGGIQWQEVLQPEPGSDVIDLSFIEDGQGWALVIWTTESPGRGTLYYSADWGQTWQKLPDIPDVAVYNYPVDVHFDHERGELMVWSSEGCRRLVSSDGGETWLESAESLAWNECEYFGGSRDITAADGTRWQFDIPSGPRLANRMIEIARWRPSDTSWTIVSKFSDRFRYVDGRVTNIGE